MSTFRFDMSDVRTRSPRFRREATSHRFFVLLFCFSLRAYSILMVSSSSSDLDKISLNNPYSSIKRDEGALNKVEERIENTNAPGSAVLYKEDYLKVYESCSCCFGVRYCSQVLFSRLNDIIAYYLLHTWTLFSPL